MKLAMVGVTSYRAGNLFILFESIILVGAFAVPEKIKVVSTIVFFFFQAIILHKYFSQKVKDIFFFQHLL